jgi:hypothetical protein
MPLRLEIKKELSSRSDRVKSVDIHTADRPWVLCALYNGNVFIWDYSTNVSCRCHLEQKLWLYDEWNLCRAE